ncbi:WD40 repeat domain-containing protein [Gordonia sp. MP11Mi]|uniref:Novel STAND NTPase 1 domain-containing protein n=1 Tax=Gordonia sp. MP11Mi TaxID=3022769 RepID=A0AA97CW53_9ACTN
MSATQSGDAFGEALRKLFRQAGQPTLAAAARAASGPNATVSRQRISDWRSGRHIPREYTVVEPLITWLTWRAIDMGAVGVVPLPRWKKLWAAVQVRSTADSETALIRSPFRGLDVLTEDDTDLFFGRAPTVDALVSHLDAVAETGESQVVVVTGVSGSGKSSVLGAGLAGAPEPWDRPYRIRVADIAAWDAPPEHEQSLVAIDQFEEVFSLDSDDRDRVLRAVEEIARRTPVVLAVRADFFDACLEIPFLARAWQEHSVIVGEMTDDQLGAVIREPIKLAGGRIDSGLAELLVRDLHEATPSDERAGRLPLLAHTLERLWDNRSGNTVSVGTYRAVGGIASAIADSAEAAWGALDADDQPAARALLLSLVQFGPRSMPMRASVDTDELHRRFPDRADRIVDRFADARLLTAGQKVTYIHDAVLTSWPRLRKSIADDAETLQWRQQLATDSQAWIDADHSSELLYSGGRLEHALDNLDGLGELRRHVLPTGGQEFLDASVRRRRGRRTALVGGVAVITVLALVAAIFAITISRQAGDLERQRNSAERTALLSSIDRLVTSDPSLAARLLLAADQRFDDDPEVAAPLTAAASAPMARTVAGHDGPVYDVSYSADGSLVATASNDRTVRLWRHHDDTSTPLVPVAAIGGFGDYVTSVTFNATRPLLAAASGDGTVRVWNIADPSSPKRIAELRPGSGTAYLTRFSPDGNTLATSSDDGSLTLYRVAGATVAPTAPTVLRGHAGAVRTLAFNTAGTLLASGGDDQTVRLWRVGDGAGTAAGQPIRGFGNITHSVAFLPNSETIVVGGDGPNVQLWDVSDPAAPRVESSSLSGVTGGSWSVAADPASPLMAQAGIDGTVRVWSTLSRTDPPPVWDLEKSTARGAVRMFSAAFDPRGGELAVGRSDGGVDVWRFPPGVRPDRGGVISGVAQSTDGTTAATVGSDTSLDLWTRDGEWWRKRGTTAVEQRVNDRPRVAMSDDGAVTATANNNGGAVELWDTADPDRPRAAFRLPVDTRYTSEVAFVPGKRILVTGASDRSVQLWDVADPSTPRALGRPLDGPTDLIRQIVADHDGRHLAVTSDDSRTYLYSLDDRRLVHTLDVGGPGTDAVFDPSGRYLFVAGDDLSAWRVDDGTLVDRVTSDRPDTLSVMAGGEPVLLTGTMTRDIVGFTIGDDGRLTDRRLVTPVLGGPRTTTSRWELPPTLNDGKRFITGGDGTGQLYSQSIDPGDGRAWVCATTDSMTDAERRTYRIGSGDDGC